MLFGFEQEPGKRLEAQVRRVGMGERQQVLGVEVSHVGQLWIDLAREEAAFEGGVVGD